MERTKKTVTFGDDLHQEKEIPAVNHTATKKEDLHSLIGLKRELSTLGNPWQVSSPALRQLCTTTPRKREAFGGNLKIFKDGIYLTKTQSVQNSSKNIANKLSRSRTPNGFNIYPVLSRITPASIPGQENTNSSSLNQS